MSKKINLRKSSQFISLLELVQAVDNDEKSFGIRWTCNVKITVNASIRKKTLEGCFLVFGDQIKPSTLQV